MAMGMDQNPKPNLHGRIAVSYCLLSALWEELKNGWAKKNRL